LNHFVNSIFSKLFPAHKGNHHDSSIPEREKVAQKKKGRSVLGARIPSVDA
jgi:hypothetical protein